MGERVKLKGTEAGLHILLELNSNHNPEKIVALAEQVGVKVIPIANYFIDEAKNTNPLVLLSYGGIPLEHISPAIKLLDQVWFGSGEN